jgi:hypothetical protein
VATTTAIARHLEGKWPYSAILARYPTTTVTGFIRTIAMTMKMKMKMRRSGSLSLELE